MITDKITGIALRSLNIREADRIVTFLTTEGKLEAVAKGIRRPKSKFQGRLEPGNDLDLLLARGRGLPTITGVSVSRVRPWIRRDLRTLGVVFNILEMADKFSEQDPDTKLFQLTTAALNRMETEARPALLRLAYDIKVLAISGVMPSLGGCVICSGHAEERFSAADGGLICGSCHAGGPLKEVTKSEVDLILELLGRRYVELDEVKTSDDVIILAERLLWAHIDYHVPATFKTREIDAEMGIPG